MDVFHAMFWNNRVFINKKHQYFNNEILVSYLNLDVDKLEEYYDDLRYLLPRVLINAEMSMDFARRDYNDRVREAQRTLSRIDNIYLSLPPYDVCRSSSKDYGERLLKVLNTYPDLFEDGIALDPYDQDAYYPDSNEYGYSTYNDNNKEIFYLTRFDLEPMVKWWESKLYLDDLFEIIEAVNTGIKNTINSYIFWLEGVLRVRYVYAKLLDGFYHIRHGFLNEYEVAAQFEKYLATEKPAGKTYMRLGSAEPQAVKHEVFRPDDGKPILCESYVFDRIGAFLYTDFFRGLKNNYVPKKCANCGRWFLLPHGKYSDYCEKPLTDEPSKTCRDVSARKKYDDKCRTDPVWLAYNRAYKAHYARFMKKKMTNAEFEKWGTYAIELREKMISGQLDFVEYERLLKV